MISFRNVLKRFVSFMLVVCMIVAMFPSAGLVVSAAGEEIELSGLEDNTIGLSYTADNLEKVSWKVPDGTTIEGSVVSTEATGCNKAHKTTLNITNTRTTSALLSFEYDLKCNGATVILDGTEIKKDTIGVYSKELNPGETISIGLNSTALTLDPTTIKITNLLMFLDGDVTTTFLVSENGSYTVDGVAVTEDYSKTQNSNTAYELAAAPNVGYKFIGWYSVNEERYFSRDLKITMKFRSEQTITAVFADENAPVFSVGETSFTDLGMAVAYAEENAIEKVTLISDGTITGNYTIPEGVTLLIPFDSANTCYATTPKPLKESAGTPNVFRTLHMNNASLTVEGAISVGGQYQAAAGAAAGSMTGSYGHIQMAGNSAVHVKNGGALYAWGYVTGDGQVAVESGASVYEWFQIVDFRGGSATTALGNRVFPFSQYYVQNVEVPLTLNAGAKEVVYTGLLVSGSVMTTAVTFAGEEGMFNMKNGTFVKSYDASTDRMNYTIDGDMQLNGMTLKMGITVDSTSYVLPITNNSNLNILSGSVVINQDLALLPGVHVNVDQNAKLTVASGKSVYLYDRDEWIKDNYVWGGKFKPVVFSPTKVYDRTDADLVDAKVDVNGTAVADGAIYTTVGGADIYSSEKTGTFKQISEPGAETITYQYTQASSAVTAHEIPITPAKLHNSAAEGPEFTETADAVAGDIFAYNSESDKWERALRNYTVTWVDADGTVLETDENVAEGTMAEYNGETPAKAEDEQYTYRFIGWDPEVSEVVKDITYKAVYEVTKKEYTITWLNEDGTTLAEEKVPYGDVPEYKGETPAKEATEEYTYTFSGWTPEITAVTGDAVYTATYTDTVNTYTVTWVDEDGTVLQTDENVEYGAMPEYRGEEPSKAGDAQYTYTFKGWTPAVDQVTGDITYTAVYEATVNQYTVTWVNDDGTVIKEEAVKYGELPVYSGETPTKADEVGYSYTFKGWTPEIAPVTGDVTYKAEYEANEREDVYTVIWKNADGTVLETDENVVYGTTPTYDGATPTKADDDENSYVFKGWTPELATVTGDAEYTAEYTAKSLVRYTVTFEANGAEGTMDPQTFIEGKDIALNANAFTWENHEFIGWNTAADGTGIAYAAEGSLMGVKEDITLYAQWKVLNGLYICGEDTYWMKDGEPVLNAGLVKVQNEDGNNLYYYFGEDGKAVKNVLPGGKDFWVEKTNNLLPKWGYYFDANGVIFHDDQFQNGIVKDANDVLCYYIDGIKAPMGLMEVDGAYYYVRSNGELVVDRSYYCSNTNGLKPEGTYAFDADGKMILPDMTKNGIVEENGSLYYYVDGSLTYAGLIQIGDAYYYVKTTGEVIHGRDYWISKTNGLLPEKSYTFDETGKIVLPDTTKNGIVEENGSLYYYVNGSLNYAGLIQIDGAYYYVKTTGEVIHGRSYWISKTNGLLPEKSYTFAEDGKMVIN